MAVGQSRWILATLSIIAAALLVATFSIRGKGALVDPALPVAGVQNDATPAFIVPLDAAAVPHSLDLLIAGDRPAVLVNAQPSVAVAAGTTVTITGWAFDAAADSDFPAIGARVSGAPQIFSAAMHLVRPDVQDALRKPAARYSGFRLNIDTARLAPGSHTVVIRALAANRRTAALLAPPITINVTNLLAAEQQTDVIESLNGVGVDAGASKNTPLDVWRSYANNRLTVSGWGFITHGDRLAGRITLLVDGKRAGSARYGLPRPDVAEHFANSRLTNSGFEGSLTSADLSPGEHTIQLGLQSREGAEIPSASRLHIRLR